MGHKTGEFVIDGAYYKFYLPTNIFSQHMFVSTFALFWFFLGEITPALILAEFLNV